MWYVDPSPWEVAGLWGSLASQPGLIGDLRSQCETLSQKARPLLGMTPAVDLGLHVHARVHTMRK